MAQRTKASAARSALQAVIPESVIQRHILQFLQLSGVFCWRNKSEGTFDAKRGIYRKMTGFGHMRGTADILGIYRGVPLAIEVKSRTGVISEHQKEFLTRFQMAGGIAMIARSVDDVKKGLEKWVEAKRAK